MSHHLVIVAALIAAVGRAQDGAPAVVLPAPGSPCVAVGFLDAHTGGDGGSLAPDVARVLAAVRCARARAAAPQVAVSVHVDDQVTAVAVACRRADADALAVFLAAFTAVPGSDDEIALAIAAAALACDDDRHLLPGGELAAAARAALCPDGPAPIGSEALSALTPARMRDLAKSTRRALAGVAGDVPSAVRELAATDANALTVARRSDPAVAVGDDRIVGRVHRRVDQPFVAAAFAVPADLDRATLAVAVAVARDRAARRWQLRGSELRAGTPFVDWSWLRGDGIVTFHRRGVAPVRLRPGEPAADVAAERDATAGELRGLLADLRRPVEDRELLAARAQAAAELGCQLRPDGPDPAMVALCLRQALLRAARGCDAAHVAAVSTAAATTAIARLLEGPRRWSALLPTSSASLGWRPR